LKILSFLSLFALIEFETLLFLSVLLIFIRKVDFFIFDHFFLLFLHSYRALVDLTPVRSDKGLVPSTKNSVNFVVAFQKVHFYAMRLCDLH
jgi:hypothetical protein